MKWLFWPDSKKVPGSKLWSLHVVRVLAWVSSGYSGFLSQFKDMHVRLIGGSILPIGVIVSVHVGLSSCGPVMDW